MFPIGAALSDEIKLKRILVVDDELVMVTLMEGFLQGLNVISTTDPRQAIEIYKNEEIALVISDFNMPRLNGLELYAELKKLASDRPSPLVFYMASSFAEDGELKKTAYALGINEYFSKPISYAQFRTSVELALGCSADKKS